ncbi:MAG: GGDEF domain-containing protein [Solirubrobacteraceae bacterium]|nr:GGDEF domain-containing protein [Solirubrobacteraceae bacterium]
MTASAPTPALSRRVSRRELAVNRTVWLATGGMFAFYSAIAIAALAFTDVFPSNNLAVIAVGAAVVAIFLLRSEPPPIGSPRNHMVVALTYVVTSAGMFASAPSGAFTLGGAFFIGPLAAVRLQDRRQIAAHLLASNILIFGVALFGGLSTAGVMMTTLFNLASWVLCFSCVVALEAAEAQGDELEQLVRRDPLTGVGNRRLLLEVLEDEIARHGRTGRELSLIALDLDGFKSLNDDVGHAAGDQLLHDVANAVVAAVEPRDTVVRQGGDEFCIVLPETSPALAERSANAVRAALAQVTTPDGERISSGLGIASFPKDALSGEVLLHVADERLRLSKGERTKNEPGASAPASDRRFGQA